MTDEGQIIEQEEKQQHSNTQQNTMEQNITQVETHANITPETEHTEIERAEEEPTQTPNSHISTHITVPPHDTPVQVQHTPTADISLHSHPLRPFNVVSFNVCGISSITRRHEISSFLHNERPSVLVIQEPKLGVKPVITQPPSFYPYNCVYFPHTRADTGIIFYIHPSIMYRRHDDTPHCADYNPEKKTTTVAFVTLFSEALTQPLILGGTYIDNSSSVAVIKAIARRANDRLRVAATPTPPTQLDQLRQRIDELARNITPTLTPPPPTEALEVLTSHIPGAGLGLFTRRQIKGNHKICDYPGELIDKAEFQRRYPDGKGIYVAGISKNKYIDAVNTRSYGRYANNRPNHNKCVLKTNTITNKVSIWLKTGQTLEPGEEVCVSYGPGHTLPPAQQPHMLSHLAVRQLQKEEEC